MNLFARCRRLLTALILVTNFVYSQMALVSPFHPIDFFTNTAHYSRNQNPSRPTDTLTSPSFATMATQPTLTKATSNERTVRFRAVRTKRYAQQQQYDSLQLLAANGWTEQRLNAAASAFDIVVVKQRKISQLQQKSPSSAGGRYARTAAQNSLRSDYYQSTANAEEDENAAGRVEDEAEDTERQHNPENVSQIYRLTLRIFSFKLKLELHEKVDLLSDWQTILSASSGASSPLLMPNHPHQREIVNDVLNRRCHYEVFSSANPVAVKQKLSGVPQISGAISACSNGLNGVLFVGNTTVVIRSLRKEVEISGNSATIFRNKIPHLVYVPKVKEIGQCANSEFEWGLRNNNAAQQHIDGNAEDRARRANQPKSDGSLEIRKSLDLGIIVDAELCRRLERDGYNVHETVPNLINLLDLIFDQAHIDVRLKFLQNWCSGNHFAVAATNLRETVLNMIEFLPRAINTNGGRDYSTMSADSYQLLSGEVFGLGAESGMAVPNQICTFKSAAIQQVTSFDAPSMVAVQMAHMISHNLGVGHTNNQNNDDGRRRRGGRFGVQEGFEATKSVEECECRKRHCLMEGQQ